ncbi:MAG: hypothetical protein ACI9SI_001970 [Polaribacter sp.]|jgi:hypothetical protein
MRNILFLVILLLAACKPVEKPLTALQIINKSIAASGMDKIGNSTIEFQFRNRDYKATRDNGKFSLERITTKDDTVTRDILSNNGFERYQNFESVIVPDDMAARYSASVNSVHYFSVLPYGLNDTAVHKKLLKEVTVKGKEYYKIEVTFSENGGGEDFEDVFIYWVGKENFLVDYLAYSYHTSDSGMRFRVLKEQCVRNGVRFVDFHNYKPKNASISLEDIDAVFENGGLEKLSEIVLENIKVVQN